MAKVEAIKRKEEKELDALPNNDDPINKEDDSGYESENCGEPWKNYKDEKYIINKDLEIIGLTRRIMFFLCIVHVVKLTNHGWRRKTYYQL